MRNITLEQIELFHQHLAEEEKAKLTIQKYIHDVMMFADWVGDRELNKGFVIEYKTELAERYSPASVNAALSSLNSFFSFLGRIDLKVKTIKIQKQIFASSEKELSKAEYERLLKASQKDQRLYLFMQTICSTGIRVSELRYITAEAVESGKAIINCKGKRRTVFLSHKLCGVLKRYLKEHKIKSGPVFITKNGKPLDRSNIWSSMKALCRTANVSEKKVFPHNLRHLFARTYYSIQKDIVRLADILGHSNVNTTRIYTQETGEIHRIQIQKLGLLLC